MIYITKITYKDNVTLNLTGDEEDCKSLFQALSSQKIFWSKEGKNGFWTNLSDIRYIHILKEEEKVEENSTSEVPPSA